MMQTEPLLWFADFRLDPGNACLWHGEEAIKLKPKAFEVLRYLATHPGQLVTREALWQAVWADVMVSDAVLTVCVREIRQVLQDNARTPRFVETVHRRGYRFIATVHRTMPPASQVQPVPVLPSQPTAPTMVGREVELAQLQEYWEAAQRGVRQIVFLSGEPGIGKTVVAETFLTQAMASGHVWMGRGQCIEHYGVGEAYLPVLQALGALGRSAASEAVREVLRQQAPSWLVQMPALLSAAERDNLQQQTHTVTRERMLREIAEALETLTAEHTLILFFEDLQWSDPSTVEFVALLARRRAAARLFILGTYRSAELIVHAHPLRIVQQELGLHGQCVEIALPLLPQLAVTAYLTQRFADQEYASLPLATLARVVYQHTDGNPLFMVTMVEYLATRALVRQGDGTWALSATHHAVAAEVPDDIRQMIERQIARLTVAEQHILEVASVIGTAFSAAAVAAGLACDVIEVEALCDALVQRQQFLGAAGIAEWYPGNALPVYPLAVSERLFSAPWRGTAEPVASAFCGTS